MFINIQLRECTDIYFKLVLIGRFLVNPDSGNEFLLLQALHFPLTFSVALIFFVSRDKINSGITTSFPSRSS